MLKAKHVMRGKQTALYCVIIASQFPENIDHALYVQCRTNSMTDALNGYFVRVSPNLAEKYFNQKTRLKAIYVIQ